VLHRMRRLMDSARYGELVP